MIDTLQFASASDIRFYSDASASRELGYGCLFENRWLYAKWNAQFIDECNPSIEFLELYGLCAGFFTWQKDLKNTRITVFCDNMGVVHMVNNMSSKCKHCMMLIRLLVLNGLIFNRRIYVKYIDTKSNFLANHLSPLRIKKFLEAAPAGINKTPDKINPELGKLEFLWKAARQ